MVPHRVLDLLPRVLGVLAARNLECGVRFWCHSEDDACVVLLWLRRIAGGGLELSHTQEEDEVWAIHPKNSGRRGAQAPQPADCWVPRVLGVVPGVRGVVPKVAGVLHGVLGVVPRVLGLVPRALGVVPRVLAVVARVLGLVFGGSARDLRWGSRTYR